MSTINLDVRWFHVGYRGNLVVLGREIRGSVYGVNAYGAANVYQFQSCRLIFWVQGSEY